MPCYQHGSHDDDSSQTDDAANQWQKSTPGVAQRGGGGVRERGKGGARGEGGVGGRRCSRGWRGGGWRHPPLATRKVFDGGCALGLTVRNRRQRRHGRARWRGRCGWGCGDLLSPRGGGGGCSGAFPRRQRSRSLCPRHQVSYQQVDASVETRGGGGGSGRVVAVAQARRLRGHAGVGRAVGQEAGVSPWSVEGGGGHVGVGRGGCGVRPSWVVRVVRLPLRLPLHPPRVALLLPLLLKAPRGVPPAAPTNLHAARA
mmetsp:Transcript_39173/g.75080  ORF Transcript_39173/g.75080 Transcript_39173/m.75080 type:complete len:257 (+) Transcript_39173:445-1215(+)